VALANQVFGQYWTIYGFFGVLIGLDEFLQVFDGLSGGCGEAASFKT